MEEKRGPHNCNHRKKNARITHTTKGCKSEFFQMFLLVDYKTFSLNSEMTFGKVEMKK